MNTFTIRTGKGISIQKIKKNKDPRKHDMNTITIRTGNGIEKRISCYKRKTEKKSQNTPGATTFTFTFTHSNTCYF
jgi:hypothetical protein